MIDMVTAQTTNQATAEDRSGSARVLVNDLHVGYTPGVEVLHDVSIDIRPGETLSLLGPSGCGKTTLLRTIAGLQRPSAGVIQIDGRVVNDERVHVDPNRRRVGMVFQDGALFPHLTVRENVAFGLRDHTEPDKRVGEMLDLVDLSRLADRMPDTLSGGQRQRVALARALAPNPKVLLLDEPFSALDAGMRTQIRRDVKKILNQIGITAVLVTHDQDEAFVLGDRVALMRDGELVQVGASTELYDRPHDRWVADFVGEANIVAGTSADSPGGEESSPVVQTMFGVLPIVEGGDFRPGPGGRVEVLIRPEQLELIRPGEDGTFSDVRPRLKARVEQAEYFGHDVLYQLDHGGASLVVRTPDSGFRSGDEVSVRFRGRGVVVWPPDLDGDEQGEVIA